MPADINNLLSKMFAEFFRARRAINFPEMFLIIGFFIMEDHCLRSDFFKVLVMYRKGDNNLYVFQYLSEFFGYIYKCTDCVDW